MHEHKVGTAQLDLQHGQAEEIKAKVVGGFVWLAVAIMVSPPRLKQETVKTTWAVIKGVVAVGGRMLLSRHDSVRLYHLIGFLQHIATKDAILKRESTEGAVVLAFIGDAK